MTESGRRGHAIEGRDSCRRVRRWGVILGSVVLVGLCGLAVLAASADGYWAGEEGLDTDSLYDNIYGNPWIYPVGFCSFEQPEEGRRGLGAEDHWHWSSSQLTLGFYSSAGDWTEEERRVVGHAVSEWNEVCVPLGLTIRLVDDWRSADVVLQWIDFIAFGYGYTASSGVFLPDPDHVAQGWEALRFTVESRIDELRALGRPSRNTILLNRRVSWHVLDGSQTIQTFERLEVVTCGDQRAVSEWVKEVLDSGATVEEVGNRIARGEVPPFALVFRATEGTPAATKWDLRTVVAHEIGHALGLMHSGGCLGCSVCPPYTYGVDPLTCDAGSIMFGGEQIPARRGSAWPYEGHVVGYGEARTVLGYTPVLWWFGMFDDVWFPGEFDV